MDLQVYTGLCAGSVHDPFANRQGVKPVTTYRYTIILEREPDGGFHAYCPTLKGCHSQGDSLDEAIDNIREAIDVYLESVEAHGEPIPQEDILITPVEVAR